MLARLRRGGGYLARLEASPGLVRATVSTLSALRRCGLAAGDLSPRFFEVEDKGRELISLLSAYEEELSSRNLIDLAGVMRLAAQRLRDGHIGPAAGLPGGGAGGHAGGTARPGAPDVGGRPHGETRLVLPVDRPCDGRAGRQQRLRPARLDLPTPGRPLLPHEDGSVKMFRAVGEVNEVREVLRRCSGGGIPFDEVEILHTDAATYRPAHLRDLLLARPGRRGRGPRHLRRGHTGSLLPPGARPRRLALLDRGGLPPVHPGEDGAGRSPRPRRGPAGRLELLPPGRHPACPAHRQGTRALPGGHRRRAGLARLEEITSRRRGRGRGGRRSAWSIWSGARRCWACCADWHARCWTASPTRMQDGDGTAARGRGFPRRASTRGQRTGRLQPPAPTRRDKGTACLPPGGRYPLFLCPNRMAGWRSWPARPGWRARVRGPAVFMWLPWRVEATPGARTPLSSASTTGVFLAPACRTPSSWTRSGRPSPRTSPPPRRAWPRAWRISRARRQGCGAR